MKGTALRQRTSTPGAVLDLIVLCCDVDTVIGVDSASGAFVRGVEPDVHRAFAPFTVARGVATDLVSLDRPEQPELVEFVEPLIPVDRLTPRRVEPMLRPLLHPWRRPLLGFHGPSIPWWEHEGGPSVALIEAQHGPILTVNDGHLRCHFVWSGLRQELPVADLRLTARLAGHPEGVVHPSSTARALGFRPERLVVSLAAPVRGYCPKVVSGLLP